MNLLDTKVNPNCLFFHRERERERERQRESESRLSPIMRGGRGGRVVGWCWVLLSVPGCPTNLDNSRARTYCACSRCGWGCLDMFSLVSHFSFLSPSLEGCPIETEILSQRPVKPKTTNQPNPVVSGKRTTVYSCYYVYSKVSDKNACRSIDSDLTTYSTILDSIPRRFVVV